MNRVVIDHNILFAAIHTRTSYTRQKLLDCSDKFYTPNFLIVELFKHRQRIVSKSKASQEEVLAFLTQVTQRIHFFNEELISVENFFKAYHLCKQIDENDTPYVALALELNAQLWTRDEVLKNGLRLQGFNHFFDENLT